MDIPLPQEVSVALIPTPPKPLAIDPSITLPRPKITLKPTPSLRQLPLPSRPPVSLPPVTHLPPVAPGPLFCNIPMPDEQPTPTLPPDDPNRYSPSAVLSDDDTAVTSNASSTTHSNRFLVLGKAQAKKRLLAFSSTKQAGGAGLVFNLPKKVIVKKNPAKGFEGSAEAEQTPAVLPVTKKKLITKKVVKEDRARAVINAIEEIKREELLLRGGFRMRAEPTALGDVTAPIPLPGEPIHRDEDHLAKSTHKRDRGDLADERNRDRKREDRRKEKKPRSKSDHHSRDRDKERHNKAKEKEEHPPPPTSPPPLVLPLTWAEFRTCGMTLDQIRHTKIELESKKSNSRHSKLKESKEKLDFDYEKEICNPLDYPSRVLEPFTVVGARQRTKQYTRDMIRFTKCKPSLSFCINPDMAASRYRTKAEVMEHAKPASVAIMECIINPAEEVAVAVEVIAEDTKTSRDWYPTVDNFLPPSLFEETNHTQTSVEVESHPSSQTTLADSGVDDGPKSADSLDDKVSSQVSTTDVILNSGVVSSKWDSDYEDGEVKDFEAKEGTPEYPLMPVDKDIVAMEQDSTGSDIISASDVCRKNHAGKEHKGEEAVKAPLEVEAKDGSDVMSPDQSGLHTRPTSSGADSDPNLQNEYEEFMKSVTVGGDEDDDEVIDKADETKMVLGKTVCYKSESEGHVESVAVELPPSKSLKKKGRPGFKPKKTSKKEARTIKDKKKRRPKGKKKKRRRSTSTSSSSTDESSEDEQDLEVEHTKKAKKRKKKVRATKKKKSHKKIKKRRRKSSSSDEESSSSESSSSSSSESSGASSSSSDYKKRAKKRKKSTKSKDKKSGKKLKKNRLLISKKNEKIDEIVDPNKELKAGNEKQKDSIVIVNHITSEIKKEPVDKVVTPHSNCFEEVDLQTTQKDQKKEIPTEKDSETLSAKSSKKKSKKHTSLESDEEEDTRSRKKRRKYSTCTSPVERKHRRSPSSSPDHNDTAKRRCSGERSKRDETRSTENGDTHSMANGKKSGKGERKHNAEECEPEDVAIEQQDDVVYVDCVENVDLTEVELPEESDQKDIPTQLEQSEVDKLKNAAADVWENDSQLDESAVNSLSCTEWERDSPIVEKLPRHQKEVSSNWFKPGVDHSSPSNEEADMVKEVQNVSSLSDDLHQEVEKRSLRELKYLQKVIKFEVGNEACKQDSQSDSEMERHITNFKNLNDVSIVPTCANDKVTVTSFVEDFGKESFFLSPGPLTVPSQASVPTSELYSPTQEDDAKSTRSNSPVELESKLVAAPLKPTSQDDSDMSLDSTCSNRDIDVPNQHVNVDRQWSDFESKSTNFCFPLDNIPLPPSGISRASVVSIDDSSADVNNRIHTKPDVVNNTLVPDKTVGMLEQIMLPVAKSHKVSKELQEIPVVAKAKHVITVKLLPTAKRLQSKPIGADVKAIFSTEDLQTGWIPVVGPAPVTASVEEVAKVTPTKRPSRWSDAPAVPIVPAQAVDNVHSTIKQETENSALSSVDIFADQLLMSTSVPQNVNIDIVLNSSEPVAEVVKVEETSIADQSIIQGTETAGVQKSDLLQESYVPAEVALVIKLLNKDFQDPEIDTKEVIRCVESEEFGTLNNSTSSEKDVAKVLVSGESACKSEGTRVSEKKDRDDSRRRDSRDKDRDGRKRDSNRSDSSRDRRDDRSRDGRRSSPGREDRRRNQLDRPRSSGKDSDAKGVPEARGGSPRRKSLERTERRKSPNRDERNRSPNKDERHKSPIRDSRARSPARDARNRSINRDARVRSPARDARRRSPNRDTGHRSPTRDGRGRSPNRDGRHKSPARDVRNRSPNRDGRNKSPSRDGRNRSPNRDGRNRSPNRDGRRRDARKRSPNRDRGTDSRDDSRRHDDSSRSRGRGRTRSGDSGGGSSPSGRGDQRGEPLSSIPLPDVQFHGRDDCNSMDMEFSSPVSTFSPLVGLKRSLADSTTISDEEIKLAHSGGRQPMTDDYGTTNPDYYAMVKIESNQHPSMHNATPTYESELSPKRLSLDERLELELGLRVSPKHQQQIPTVAAAPTRDAQYQQHWPYQNSYGNPVDPPNAAQSQYPGSAPETFAGQATNQFAPPQSAYFSQPPPQINYAGAHNIPAVPSYPDNNYMPRAPYAQIHTQTSASANQHSLLRPIPEVNFALPSYPADNCGARPAGDDMTVMPPLPVPCPVDQASPGLVGSRGGSVHHSNILVPITLTHLPPPVAGLVSPLALAQPPPVTGTQSDPQIHQIYPKMKVYAGDLAKEPLQQFYTSQLQEASLEPNVSLPVHVKDQSPEGSAVDKKALQKKAAREKLRKEKEDRRLQVENARLLKIEKFAKYKEAIQEEGDTLRRSVTLNLEEIRLNTGSQSASRASTSKVVKPRVATAIKVVPLPEASKGILISIGFREKPVSGPEAPRKSVMFADGVRPGEGSSPSAEEDLPSPVHTVPKKKLHKKKKKIKVHVIRQQAPMEESDEEVYLPLPPPPPLGSPPPHLKPFAFPGPDPGMMFPQPPNGFANPRTTRPSELPAADTCSAPLPLEAPLGPQLTEPIESSYPDMKTMKLLFYHQAMMTVKGLAAEWHSRLSPLTRAKPVTPPMVPKHVVSQPATMFDLSNGFPPTTFGAGKPLYSNERIPVVSCSPCITGFAASPAYCHLPPPPLPQSPQLRNPPPPPPPTRNKGNRWPP